MNHGSLFSGIGGFDLAAEWMGWTNFFHCEINDYCQKILNQHFPNAESYTDITATDFSGWKGKCDIVTGGFPCQPYSQAGRRKGKEDDRHLWPQMLRAIGEIQPAWIVGENVPGLLNWERGMVLAEIYADLEAQGFEVFPPLILPACGKNAPHRRDRLFIVAHRNSIKRKPIAKDGEWENSKQISEGGLLRSKPSPAGESGIIADSHCEFTQGCENNGVIDCSGKKSHEQSTGFFRTTWKEFPTKPPVCGGNDGIPRKLDRIKALGNAIVPQVAFEIFKAIEEIIKWQKV